LHTKTARSRGETEQRIYELMAWRESPYYTERERAALAWAEAVTLVSIDHVPDALYETVREQFTDEELIYLTLAIISINSWNRLAISFRRLPE
jgi:alkylhydroperoxidase family enzyme